MFEKIVVIVGSLLVAGLLVLLFCFLFRLANVIDLINKQEMEQGTVACAPAHYQQTVKVAEGLYEISCIDTAGVKKSIYVEK